jgi:hypothetical protein
VGQTELSNAASVERKPKPLTKKAWFWATIGAAVIVVGAGVALGVVFGSPHDPTPTFGRVQGP